MAQEIINVGLADDDGNGDTWRAALTKCLNNFAELFGLVSDNTVLVKSAADLPTPVSVGGVLTHVLENKEYIFDGPVTIENPFGYPGTGNRATLKSVNRAAVTYTGGIAMFRDPAAAGIIEISGLTEFRAPGAKMWDLTGAFVFQASGEADRFTECESLGVLNCNGVSVFNIFFATLSNFNQGLVVNDSAAFQVSTAIVQGNNAASCVYFTVQGASTSGSVNFDALTMTSGTNETFFDINTNIQTGIDSVNIRACQEQGGLNGAVFSGSSLNEKDNKVIATGNQIIGDTIPGGLLYLTENTTETVISAVDTPALVAGTWGIGEVSQFTGSTGGRLTYDDIRDLSSDIDISISVEPATGNGKIIRAYVAKNGVEIAESGKSATADNGKAATIPLSWRTGTSTTDYYEVFVENKTDSINIIAIDATLRIP